MTVLPHLIVHIHFSVLDFPRKGGIAEIMYFMKVYTTSGIRITILFKLSVSISFSTTQIIHKVLFLIIEII